MIGTRGRNDAVQTGMLIMAATMLIVPSMDALAKLLTAWLSPVMIAFMRYVIQSLVMVTWLSMRHGLVVPRAHLAMLALSGGLVAAAMTSLIWGLSVLPLANAIAIFFIEPFILTLLSAVFLGERIGWRRILAVVVGFAGAMIVIRPNWSAFGWHALLPVSAAFFFALYITVTRYLTGHLSGLVLQTWSGLFSLALVGVVLLVGSSLDLAVAAMAMPPTAAWPLLIGLGLIGALTHLMVAMAFARTPAAILAPFQYLEIIGAVALGYLVFGDLPDAMTWLGTTIILGSGLYVFARERQLAVRRSVDRSAH